MMPRIRITSPYYGTEIKSGCSEDTVMLMPFNSVLHLLADAWDKGVIIRPAALTTELLPPDFWHYVANIGFRPPWKRRESQ